MVLLWFFFFFSSNTFSDEAPLSCSTHLTAGLHVYSGELLKELQEGGLYLDGQSIEEKLGFFEKLVLRANYSPAKLDRHIYNRMKKGLFSWVHRKEVLQKVVQIRENIILFALSNEEQFSSRLSLLNIIEQYLKGNPNPRIQSVLNDLYLKKFKKNPKQSAGDFIFGMCWNIFFPERNKGQSRLFATDLQKEVLLNLLSKSRVGADFIEKVVFWYLENLITEDNAAGADFMSRLNEFTQKVAPQDLWKITTLISFIREQAIDRSKMKRPGNMEFLHEVLGKFEIALWDAAPKKTISQLERLLKLSVYYNLYVQERVSLVPSRFINLRIQEGFHREVYSRVVALSNGPWWGKIKPLAHQILLENLLYTTRITDQMFAGYECYLVIYRMAQPFLNYFEIPLNIRRIPYLQVREILKKESPLQVQQPAWGKVHVLNDFRPR